MDNLRNSILTSINRASFSAADVALWESVLTNVPEELLSSLADFINTSPDSLKYLNENLKKKYAAFESGDEKLLSDTFLDQQNFLDSLTEKASN